MTDFTNISCIQGCKPPQIINLNLAINDVSKLEVYDECGSIYTELKYAYSIDSACWSCYMSYNEILENTIELVSDFYVRLRVQGNVSKILINGEEITDFSTQLESGFNLQSYDVNSNTWNPYSNIDCSISLYQQLNESIASISGIPIYYFKVNGVKESADMTFKEYALKSVSSIKQIKLIVSDGQMPSSKPEFAEFGLDWQTDWEVEISKGMFATAFGNTAQPTEGDLVYIPLMSRMWMVNEAYEEKKDSFMWHAATWKVALVKYQDDSSVDLGFSQDMVDDIVKNKYEDIFGEEENQEAQIDAAPILQATPNDLYPIFRSDAVRKYMSCNGIDIIQSLLYYKGTLVSENMYKFALDMKQQIIYQHQYCGDSGTLSFIIKPGHGNFSGYLLELGQGKRITILQKAEYDNKGNVKSSVCNLSIDKNNKLSIDLIPGNWYFVWIRWSKELNTFDFNAAKYSFPENIPLYKLQNHHYYFDFDNAITKVGKWNYEYQQNSKVDLILNNFIGTISNIKLFDVYNDNTSEILMQYPNNKHLLINDTVRPIVGLDGVIRNS